MKNADMPIHGQLEMAGGCALKDGGLTKREHFAALAMQGLLAAKASHPLEDTDACFIACDALECADALLKELDCG